MKILFALCLYALTNSAIAQVYSFTPKYLCTSFGDRHDKTLFFNDVDTGFNNLVIIDLDKKTITAPSYPLERMEEMAIDEVTYDARANTYWIKTRRNKAKDHDKHFFKLKMNEHAGYESDPGYLQEITNVYHSSDSLFVTITNHPEALFFHANCLFEKSNTTLSSDSVTRQRQMDEVFDDKFKVADNFFDMHDGYITWTKGKGKNAQTIRFNIIEVTYSKDANRSALSVECYIPGNEDETYLVVYDYTFSRFDPTIPPNIKLQQFFVLLAKFKNQVQVEEYVFK